MPYRLSQIYSILTVLFFALLLLLTLLWSFQRFPSRSLHAQGELAADNGCQLGAVVALAEICHAPQVTPALLAIYVLAFDNAPGSPSSLRAYYTPTVQSIVSATAAAHDRVAVILADLDGYGDTHVLIAQNGVLIPVEGLPFAQNPATLVALDPALEEYNMADGWYLGNFIRWARQLYPVNQTIFSFVGHGAPLTPQLRPLTEGALMAEPTSTPPGAPVPQDEISPLPPRWGAHSDLTDYHSASLISVRGLAQALSIGTENGANPLSVVDLLHCFSATIEELYEIHPYAKTIIAAPNYTYAQPTMLGEMLAVLDPTQPPAALAQTLVAGYDNLLPLVDHPRLFIAVDADKIAPIKTAWDQTAQGLLAAWDANADATRDRLLTAYHASAKYDTTICQPQDWQLAPPDALSDMADFANHVRDEFGAQSTVGAWAMTTTQAISEAILARHSHDGTPWFANGSPAPQWTFPLAGVPGGIALFTDFAPASVANRPQFSWQAAWYTTTVSIGNPYPYAFIRPTAGSNATWADLFSRFWTKPITSTAGCIQGFVNGRGVGALSLIALTPITTTRSGSIFFSATVHSTQAATNPLLRFRAYHTDQVAFETVVGSGYFAAGSRQTVQSTVAWQPFLSGRYTIEATIDVDQRFSEENEADNVITLTVPISVPNLRYLPILLRDSTALK